MKRNVIRMSLLIPAASITLGLMVTQGGCFFDGHDHGPDHERHDNDHHDDDHHDEHHDSGVHVEVDGPR